MCCTYIWGEKTQKQESMPLFYTVLNEQSNSLKMDLWPTYITHFLSYHLLQSIPGHLSCSVFESWSELKSLPIQQLGTSVTNGRLLFRTEQNISKWLVGRFDTASSVAEVAALLSACSSVIVAVLSIDPHSNLKPLLQFTITDSVAACNHSKEESSQATNTDLCLWPSENVFSPPYVVHFHTPILTAVSVSHSYALTFGIMYAK